MDSKAGVSIARSCSRRMAFQPTPQGGLSKAGAFISQKKVSLQVGNGALTACKYSRGRWLTPKMELWVPVLTSAIKSDLFSESS